MRGSAEKRRLFMKMGHEVGGSRGDARRLAGCMGTVQGSGGSHTWLRFSVGALLGRVQAGLCAAPGLS